MSAKCEIVSQSEVWLTISHFVDVSNFTLKICFLFHFQLTQFLLIRASQKAFEKQHFSKLPLDI